MSPSAHSLDRQHQKRLRAFGWTGDKVAKVCREMPAGLPDVALVLASRERKVTVGRATGKHLVAIIRNDRLVTVVIADKLCPKKLRVRHIVH
jgi:hypothetical protein